MSISSKLTDIRTAIANSYGVVNAKGGTLPQKQCLNNLPNAIDSIPIGGTSEPPLLFFYDYDGSLIDSYGASEIQDLSELPSAPDHSTDDVPLTFQEWNWSLSAIKTYNTAYPYAIINVGAIYVPSDGKTHIRFEIGSTDSKTVRASITTTGGTVDWGDGDTETISSTTLTHTYSSAGTYDCSLTVVTAISLYTTDSTYRKASKINYGSSIIQVGTISLYQYYPLEYVTIPTSVKTLGQTPFYYCTALKSVNIPSSITTVNTGVFSYCYSLKVATLPYTLPLISNSMFSYCTTLESITIPQGVSEVGTKAFQNCYSLRDVSIPSSITSIPEGVFQACYSLDNVVVPSSVTVIGKSVFYQCYGLSKIQLPATVTSVDTYLFYSCYSLSSVTLPSGMQTLGTMTFFYCYGLTHVSIPSTVTTIGDNVFNTCHSLTSVTIPSSVTSIGSGVFGSCSSLYSITVEATTPPTLTNVNSINTTYTKKIYVPASAVEDYKSASNWSTFSSIIEAIPS